MSSDSIRLLTKEEGKKVIARVNAVRKEEAERLTKDEWHIEEAAVGLL